MRRGEPPAAALRLAQLAVKARYAHPFYWAPFILIGRG
jgi:CHAT domain-containing protein